MGSKNNVKFIVKSWVINVLKMMPKSDFINIKIGGVKIDENRPKNDPL
jgi:hypothetical protein